MTRLFTNIKDNGYVFMFLSSRAIAQASATRDYLHTLNQDGETLPAGPVIISPDGLFPSLYRELVRFLPVLSLHIVIVSQVRTCKWLSVKANKYCNNEDSSQLPVRQQTA